MSVTTQLSGNGSNALAGDVVHITGINRCMHEIQRPHKLSLIRTITYYLQCSAAIEQYQKLSMFYQLSILSVSGRGISPTLTIFHQACIEQSHFPPSLAP